MRLQNVRKRAQQLFLDDSISPPNDTLAGIATARHVVRLPHGSRLERWIASQQQRDGEVLHIRSLTATGWLESTLKLDQDGVVAAAHRLIVANACGRRRCSSLMTSRRLGRASLSPQPWAGYPFAPAPPKMPAKEEPGLGLGFWD